MDKQEAKHAARKATREVQGNPAYRWGIRVGVVGYGLVHILIGWLAIRLAMGDSDGQDASQQGALAEIAGSPWGVALLIALAAGMVVIVVWQLIEAAIGYREFDGFKRVRKRLSSVARAITYAALGVLSVRFVVTGSSGSSGDESQESLSGTLLSMPFGQVLVAIVGIVVIAVGVATSVKAFTRNYNEDLATELHGARAAIAGAGHIGKGIAIGMIGALFAWAAITHDPEKASGMDTALQTVRSAPFGPWLLGAVALGMVCYGLYCFLWAANPRHTTS